MKTTKRKIKKILNNPKLFFSDMYLKYNFHFKKWNPISSAEGKNSFSIIAAIYNMEDHLPIFFQSITTQSLNFKNHIKIICIDDGSIDQSAQIIGKWQKQFPDNIIYIKKTNEGQATARNLGMLYTKTEWVTFIDPDDFIHKDYFKVIDSQISQYPDIQMAVGYLIFYMNSLGSFKDTHPLKFRFKKNTVIKDIHDLGEFINLSASSSFFKNSIIQENRITFDNKVKPNFEDGKFIIDYLQACSFGKVGFIKQAKYFYRKSQTPTSTIDLSWTNPAKFLDIWLYAFLPILQHEKFNLSLSYTIQATVLYEINNYISHLINRNDRLAFLSPQQKETFLNLIKEAVSLIDKNIIWKSTLLSPKCKIITLEYFKKTKSVQPLVEIIEINRKKQYLTVSFYSGYKFNSALSLSTSIKWTLLNQELIMHEFINSTALYEYRFRIFLDSKLNKVNLKNLDITINDTPALVVHSYLNNPLKYNF